MKPFATSGLLLALVTIGIVCRGQNRTANWCFGDSAHLQFDASGPQVMPPSAFWGHEAGSSISDEQGNLLMYSSGRHIWDTEHNLMPNGTDLLSISWNPSYDLFYSETQGSLILPDPGDSMRYYVFSKQRYLPLQPKHFFYSIVNMSLRGGLGDVESGQRAVSQWDSTMLDGWISSEKMTAVRHANGRDWWLFLYHTTAGPGLYDSTLLRYTLSPEGLGLNGTQVISSYSSDGNHAGEMNFSPKGDKVAFGGSNNILRVFEFDRCSGLVGNLILVDTLKSMAYSNAFSPDGNMLYVSQHYNLITDLHGKIIQYDLNNVGQLDFKQIIYSTPDTVQNGQLQLALDGKIYLAAAIGSCSWPFCNEDLSSPWATNLSVINEPNLAGNACDFQPHSISTGGRRVFGGLPNQPHYELGALEGSPCDSLGVNVGIETAFQEEFQLFPNPVASGAMLYISLNAAEVDVVYYVYNLNGQLVLEGGGSSLNTEGLKPGLYHILIKHQSKSNRASFIVE